jgi:hypothetical protein
MPPPSLAHIVPADTSSSPTTTSAIHAQQARLLTPTTNPIPLLPTPSARLYTHLHSFLLPALYLFRASALVADPLTTLTYDILPLATLQSLFCVLCLPPAGSWNSGTKDGGRIIEGTSEVKTSASTVGRGASLGRKKGAKVAAGLSDPTVGGFGARIMVSLFIFYHFPNIPAHAHTQQASFVFRGRECVARLNAINTHSIAPGPHPIPHTAQ